ncbi:AsmA-like C-terminal region-containing protein, partial [Oharaeibacter diazotrophicus]
DRFADAREEDGRAAPGGDPRLDPAVLGVVDGGLDLTVGAIRGAALGDAGTLDGLHLVVVAEGGAATAVLDGVRLAGGSLALRVKARPDGERLRLDGSVAAKGFDVGALARLAGAGSPLAGKLGADLAFAAAGRTASALAESLDASGTVTLAGGSFAGTGLAGLFGDPAADRAEAIAVKATIASLGKPVRAEGTLGLAGRPFGFDATVDARRVLDGHAFPLAVRVTGGKVGLGFDGDVLPAEGAASGRIELRAPSLGALAAVLGRPAEGLPAGALAVTAAIDASARSVAVDGLQVKLGDGGFSGDVSLDFGARPRVGARLRGPLIDIGGMIAGAAGAAGPGAPTAATAADWSDAPLGLEGLRAFDADVSLSADALRYGALTSGPAEARITVAGGKLAVDLPSVALHRGTLTGRVGVDATDAAAAVDVAVRLERVDLAPVLAATLGTGRIGGRASADLSIRGTGGSVRALMRDLAGTASVRVEGGALLGIDVRALLASAASAIVNGLGASPDASTPFTTLAASFDVARGVATTADLALDAPALTARGAGRIDIGGKALALTVTPKLTAPGGGDALSFEVPVVIEGPWASPRIYPDVADILSDPAAAYAKLSRMGGAFAALAGAGVGAGGAGDLGAVFDRLAPGLGGALAG